jgi:hypothetical protein
VRRGRAVVLPRAGPRRQPRWDGDEAVQGVRRGGRVRAAAAVPAPVPVRRVRRGRRRVPRLRRHQERLAPRPLHLTETQINGPGQRVDSVDRAFQGRAQRILQYLFFFPSLFF